MRGLIALLACFAFVSCDGGLWQRGGPVTPPELQVKNDLASACWRDTMIVPLHHSEHCVIFAESYFEDKDEECDGDRSYECLEFRSAEENILGMYQMAIVDSAVYFGVPDEIAAASRDSIPTMVYLNGELLRALFEECLLKEQEALAKRGLRRVHEVLLPTLKEGQMCIREGNERFETAPL